MQGLPKFAVVFLIRFAHILKQGILFVKKNTMKNKILDCCLNDKFLIKVQKQIRNKQKEHYDCSLNCPLSNTSYRGNCIVWLHRVMASRNILSAPYAIKNCGELFSIAINLALDKQSKQNKI